MLEDLLNDDSVEGRSNELYAERNPAYQRVATLTGSQTRQKSLEKQKRLQQLQRAYDDLRRKLTTTDRNNERIMHKPKNQPAEREQTRNESQSPKKKFIYPATPGNLDSIRSLKQQVEMLQLQLKDKDMQLKERRLAHEQKEEFYR